MSPGAGWVMRAVTRRLLSRRQRHLTRCFSSFTGNAKREPRDWQERRKTVACDLRVTLGDKVVTDGREIRRRSSTSEAPAHIKRNASLVVQWTLAVSLLVVNTSREFCSCRRKPQGTAAISTFAFSFGIFTTKNVCHRSKAAERPRPILKASRSTSCRLRFSWISNFLYLWHYIGNDQSRENWLSKSKGKKASAAPCIQA